jgi:uncharacterized protein (UPF0303 family)
MPEVSKAGIVNPELDLQRIQEQESRLRFPAFDENTAWQVGVALKARAEALGKAVTIEITLGGATLFFHAMRGTTPANADWVRRKRNLVQLTHTSSYATGLALKRDGMTLETSLALPARDYAAHGGCFPLILAGCCVGTITVSGLPQRDDHALVVEVLAAHLGLAPETLAF